ncbi:PaaX family transcriptional regulator C-terminal domain-containing protein [Actinosynnema sp. NPDC047251]|uniref:Transcriptional regulator, PaaX family n=1 Tax=Saccharothrix espanaensis (strain ATCC 51144 / DSM 44229 / JCM 9112 / NBRC 15066 / NRRL 15764) TaxID=1179773 RepID=K0K379_SACES|nr:PaaX family transcriptional regulator C-terminal domain-containing protein [Saccharothrix espanaensis]CCH31344.1 Transcriptional regulator, PaaX family [Saccharothrix espanaensis DSM 44229]
MTTGSGEAGFADGESYAKAAQPRQFIVTLYGLFSRDHGGWLSVASVVGLLGLLDIDEAAVRSSISRLKRRDVLLAQRRDGAAGYALSPGGLAILDEGDHRIFRRKRATPADGWLLAVFSVPESERHKRHLLRSQLSRLGFGTAAPGVWIAPAHLHEPTADILRSQDLHGYADLFRADHLAFGDLAGKVRRWWDLDQLEGLYSAFLTEHGPSLRRWRDLPARDASAPGGPAVDERAAFADYVRLLTDWRRLPYLDPGLPEELLPPEWIGIRAADLFFSLQDRLEGPARAFGERTVSG